NATGSTANNTPTSMVLCCECGVPIQPNPSNMCVTCLRNHVDITEGIPKQAVLHFCRNCERYLQPPGEWIQAALESRELLALCLKKLKGLKEVKLVDAGFVWTEAHSKRIKVKLTVHGEVSGGTVLQQVFIVEFTVQNQMCDDCHRTEAKDFWRCMVQVRQRAENKKTFFRHQLGNLSPICLINKVTSGIHLIDPMTAQIAEVSGQAYFRSPFEAICNPKQLVEYIVMDVEIIMDKDRKYYPGQGQLSFRHVLCDIWVVRASELGINDNPIHTRSHLGHLLKVGDSVMGYNLGEANINDTEYDKLNAEQIPDVVLVKKCYTDRNTRSNQRLWKLRHLAEEATDERSKPDYHEFLEDLEEDPDYRKQVNIYRDAKKQMPVDGGDTLGFKDNVPRITLAEMLEDLTLECADDDMGESEDVAGEPQL
ncbi:LOW QUALITY PROTEIN: 60S ribosomal export protein NMD3-like, partial [Musca vetustissima]|uniref:LOW QUALITY PROTEIN: 60S ribosomal export protein NMD3-like n=1 Tax=Musca vetustissima TaxID=27455 RepID=UPI002AB63871